MRQPATTVYSGAIFTSCPKLATSGEKQTYVLVLTLFGQYLIQEHILQNSTLRQPFIGQPCRKPSRERRGDHGGDSSNQSPY